MVGYEQIENDEQTTIKYGSKKNYTEMKIIETNNSKNCSFVKKFGKCGIFLVCALLVCAVLIVVIARKAYTSKHDNSEQSPENVSKPKVFKTYSKSKSAFLVKGVYLPKNDVYNPTFNNIDIFQNLSSNCFEVEEKIKDTEETESSYKIIDDFYKKVVYDTGLALSLIGRFTMGPTLSVRSEENYSGQVEISGTSIEVKTVVKSIQFKKQCLVNADLTEKFLTAFDKLPVKIEKPWLSRSWLDYDTFLHTFGSHVTEKIFYGAAVRQWTFSKKTFRYSQEELKIRACAYLTLFMLKIGPCAGVTKEKAEKYTNIIVSNHLEIRGGTDETRNKFRTNRTQSLLEKLLNEGRRYESPIQYRYISLWDLLKIKFANDRKRYSIAMNLEQYYNGYLDFGCTLQTSGKTKLRWFEYKIKSILKPIFQCRLINKGCHSDADCHAITVITFCYGPSCYEYVPPEFGKKAESVEIRTSSEGVYDEDINNSCEYKPVFQAQCKVNYFHGKAIWEGMTPAPHYYSKASKCTKMSWILLTIIFIFLTF